MSGRVFRCYAEGREGQWEAICVDLDIAVQGRTLEEVHDLLLHAMGDYLTYVQELPEEERRRFYNRKAPLKDRLKFMFGPLFHRSAPIDHHDDGNENGGPTERWQGTLCAA